VGGGAAFSLAREEVARCWRELRGPATTPVRAAAAVALGLLAGAPPLAAVRLAALPLVCIWCQLDARIAVGGALLALALRRLFPLPPLAGAAAVAGAVLLVLAILAILPRPAPPPPYALPATAPPWIAAVERVAMRYASPLSPRPLERVRFHWVRWKMLADPAAQLVAELASGTLLDVGAGRGQLAVLLLELGRVTRARGVDWDAGKIAAAERAARGLDASFVRADARAAAFEPSDTVLVVDLLHYFAIDEQDALLVRAADAVLPGGRLLVREADAAAGWRSAVTLLEERVFTFLRVNRGERVRFRRASEIVARLEAAGLRCEVRSASGGTPFSNVLVVGERVGRDEDENA
jgi:SAM-dependent methyltransferase